ncbi:MAG: SpoIID/LytB domain-containing protein [candidate division KSB1 bacterium]|nr:SpoIID/LytB domain-containing protein [candidate division KSB1 bacterium]
MSIFSHEFKFKKLIPALVGLGWLISCAPVAYRPAPYIQSPVIRVGLIEGTDSLVFSCERAITVFANGHKKGMLPGGETYTLIVENSEKIAVEYQVQYAEYPNRQDAERMKRQLSRYGIQARIKETGGELQVGHRVIKGNLKYVLYDQRSWKSKSGAEKYINELGAAKARVVADYGVNTVYQIVADDKKFKVAGKVRLAGGPITISNVPVGRGYHWSRRETRVYEGDLEIQTGENGGLVVINVLPLSLYLKGVLPGEMPASFPLEALKAQAIAARTYFLHNYTRVHKSHPFDVCDDVHCQSYVGKNNNEKIRRAVRETRGQVLQVGDELCNTPYHAMCGGHTENADNVWRGDAKSYLSGVFDVEHPRAMASAMDLSREQDLERWLDSEPNVFCNIVKAGNPEFAHYAKKFFRWSETFTRQELEQSIEKYTEKKLGTLVDLIPLTRGVSGRIIELEVIGTSRTFSIKRELNIRKALSPKTLYSACFVIEPVGSENEVYEAFTFKGAGWGHGVGMCQIGAACMAHAGKTAERILEHYYQGARVVALY